MDDVGALHGNVSSSLDEDAALVQAARNDLQTFELIYRRHRVAVYRYLRSRTRSDDEAGELAAITFERALAGIGSFRPAGGGLLAWLLRIARNAHIDALRREG